MRRVHVVADDLVWKISVYPHAANSLHRAHRRSPTFPEQPVPAAPDVRARGRPAARRSRSWSKASTTGSRSRRCSASPAPARPTRWRNVIARLGRPALVHGAEQDARRAALLGDCASSSPRTRSSISSRTTTTTSPRPTSRRGTSTSRRTRSINEHIEQMRLSATKSLLERRDAIIVATVSCIYGIGDPAEYHGMILHLREREKLVAARRASRAWCEMQYQRNELRVPARHVPRARRRDRRVPGGELRARGARRARSTTRSRRSTCSTR